MSNDKPNKPWSQQTIEERVHTHLRHQEKFVARIDPDDQMLTHDNFLNRPVDYYIVDLNRTFLTILQAIVDNPPQQQPLTDDEIVNISDLQSGCYGTTEFARAIEKAHGIGGEE